MKLDFSRFCWALVPHAPHRLDLVLFCAPGLAEPLCRALPPHLRFRRHSSSSVRTSNAGAVRSVLRSLEEGDEMLCKQLDEYFRLAELLRRGKTQPEEHLADLRRICARLLKYTELGEI